MPDVRPLREDDLPQAHAAFLAAPGSPWSIGDYRPMFAPAPGGDAACGYGLFDNERLVGMLGTLLSRRTIDGRPVEVCNLHSWFVQPEYRGYSLALMRPVLRDKNRVLTDFSPSPAVCEISQRLGFQRLDGRLTLLFRPWRRAAASSSLLEIMTDRAGIDARWRGDDPTVRAALHDPTLQPLLAVDGDGDCLVLARKVDLNCPPHCHAHHVSDPARFTRWSVPIRHALLDLCGGSFVALERRRLGNAKLPCRLTLPVSSRQLVRTSHVDPPEVDTLRSELQYLGMTTLPQKRLFTSAVAARLPRLASIVRQGLDKLRNLGRRGTVAGSR